MKSFRHHRRFLVAAALAVAAACSTKSPTEPGSAPITPKVPPPPPAVTTFAITVTASPSHLTIGQTTGSKINVSAVNVQDGTPPPDLTPITLTTTLGVFNSAASGLQSINLQLVHGTSQAVLFAGGSAGTGTVGATGPAASTPPTVYIPGAATVVISQAGTFFLNSLSPNTGDPAGGTLVTISGGGFQAPVSVTFQGSSAPVKSVSQSSIQVISPPSPSPVAVGSTLQVSVTVTNGGTLGGSAQLSNAFTYVPGGGGIQQPQIFSVTPGSGTNDGGTQVTITGQNFVAPVQVFFGMGGNATSFNGIEATVQSVTSNQIIVVSPPARGFGQTNTNMLVSILVVNTGSGFSTVRPQAFQYGSKVFVTSSGPTITQFNQPIKVTIFGQGFADPVAVSLAGIAAQVLSTSGTEVQVLSGIPIVSSCANISGMVTVTNINNGDFGTGSSFTYVVPKPSLVEVTSMRNDPTGGYPADIHGAFFIPGEDQVQFGSTSVPINAGSTANDLIVTVPPFTGTFATSPCGPNNTGTQQVPTSVNVVVTDGLTSCTATLTGGFTYIPAGYPNNCVVPPPAPPTASFVFSVPTGSFKVSFTDTSTGSPTGWSWNFGDGSTITGTPTPTHTYAAPGTYNVVLTVSNAGGTSAPATKAVMVPGP
jgi:hypothetical protein